VLYVNARLDHHNAMHSLCVDRDLRPWHAGAVRFELVHSHGLVERASRTCHCWACNHETVPHELHVVHLFLRALASDEKQWKHTQVALDLGLRGNKEMKDSCLREEGADVD
jgi:hypothetical protein